MWFSLLSSFNRNMCIIVDVTTQACRLADFCLFLSSLVKKSHHIWCYNMPLKFSCFVFICSVELVCKVYCNHHFFNISLLYSLLFCKKMTQCYLQYTSLLVSLCSPSTEVENTKNDHNYELQTLKLQLNSSSNHNYKWELQK